MNRSHPLARAAAAVASRGQWVDSLEARRLFAAVTITGTSGPDTIYVSMDPNETTIRVMFNGIEQSFPNIAYDGISVNGGNGADAIYIDANGDNRTTVNGGSGTDTIYLGATIDRLDTITSPVVALSSDGDSLVIDDGASPDNKQHYVYGTGEIISDNFAGVTQSGFANVTLNAGDGDDDFFVFGTPTTGTIRLFGNDGVDAFNVFTTNGATVAVDGGAGADLLDINFNYAAFNDTVPAAVTLETTQDFDSVLAYEQSTLTLAGSAGMVLTTTQSYFEGDIRIGTGFMLERDSRSVGGLPYYRGRLMNAAAGTTGVATMSSPFATSSAIADALGYAYGSDIAPTEIAGYSIGLDDLLIRYTRQGDADMNGAVDFDDLLRVAQNYQASTVKNWADGDFNLNGIVNFDDLLLLAQNYGQSVSPAATPTAALSGSAGTRRRSTSADVIA